MKKETLIKGGLTFTAVGGVLYGAYEKVPAVHESIDSFRNTSTATMVLSSYIQQYLK